MRGGRGTMRPQLSIKSRLGLPATGRKDGGASIQSRLGTRGGLTTAGRGRGGVAAAILSKALITDARQKINLNRVLTGRVTDARENIETKRTNRLRSAELPMGSALAVSTMRSIGRGGRRGRGGRGGIGSPSFRSPVKSLQITTSTSPGGNTSAGLFRSAVTSMGGSQWPYVPPFPSGHSEDLTSDIMLTRTVRNPQANYYPAPTSGLVSSYCRITAGSGGMYSSGPSSSLTKIKSITNRPVRTQQLRATVQNHYSDEDGVYEEDMEMDDEPPPPVLRSSLKARLDVPSKFKVKVSNLQPSVTTEDIMELFADVGDLISARVLDTGTAEAFYRTKSDCHKAIEAYHNRLLDGSPMKVVLVEEGGGHAAIAGSDSRSSRKAAGVIATLKSAGGATMKIPKSQPNPNVKIHPDISAIHKVLFQPSSSSNSTKMLFNKTN